MYRELILRTNLLDLPIFALLVFVAVFAVLAVRVMRRSDWSEVSALPLETDESAAHPETSEVGHGQA
jgi:hypothetical protein